MKYSSDRKKNLIFLILVLCLGLSSTSYGEQKFEVDVDIGFDGYIKPDEATPVWIEVKNNFKDIEGKIQILEQNKYGKKNYYIAHSKDINIAKGSTKIIDMECTFNRNNLLYVRILDKNDNVVFRKIVKYLRMSRPDGIFMGILSEETDSLRYLSKTYRYSMNYSGTGSKKSFFEIAQLNDKMPENYRILNMFQVIVINNYDSEKLNIKQQEALKEWIESGGLLILGTGPNYQKTLSGLDNISFLDVVGIKEININKFGNDKSLRLIDTVLNEGEKIFIEDNEGLELYHKKLGKGNIIITGFDMGISPFKDWDKKDEFMNEVINKYLNVDITTYDDDSPMMGTHRFDDIVSYLPYNLLPSVKSILIILILFILLVGPINYFILKRIDKRELLWITIPIIVIIFYAVIYFLGFKTRLRQPIANNISIVKVDNEAKIAQVRTKSGIMGFKNGDWDVAFNKENGIETQERKDYDVIQRFADGEIITEYYSDKDNHIIFKKAGILDVKTILIDKEMKIKDKIVSDIKIKDGKLVGTINNASDLKLEDIVIFYGSKYKKLGSFKEGELSKKFEMNINNSKVIKDWYSIIVSLYGNRNYRYQKTKDEVENILNNNTKRDILEAVFGSKESVINKNRFFMLAWSRSQLEDSIRINGKEVKNIDRNLVLIPLNIKYQKGEKVSIPYGVLYPEIEDNHNMHLDRNNMILYGEGYAVFRFKPQYNINLSSMTIDTDISRNNTKREIYIYNYNKKEWEKWDEANITIDSSNMNKYYRINEGTLIKIDPKNDMEIFIPTFEVKGVIK
ncbi:hypothetical protein [Paramaledivibacter caminithermalis]|jgi:hypothetical protein|uniref:Uncharacterized protein n=1 Tax=Paramaledivibacter caminithermalis (strain DSM 15212 / CIP 107654 / DViRD3) TaxID=1121301 RepID=A0A1M6JMN7_PARC5|nr:hypothetical protein [Paramaledivibacter caminithermalis]SHJ47946.1 hypothetical protein SAMN02745912_00050 [Paramaledivibacter caminithermalis DSM 15212]